MISNQTKNDDKTGQPTISLKINPYLSFTCSNPSHFADAKGRSHVVAKDLLGTHDQKAFVVVS